MLATGPYHSISRCFESGTFPIAPLAKNKDTRGMEQLPRSPYDELGGLVYLGRMIDKIRLQQAGTLRSDLHANLGTGFDATCCEFLGVEYANLREQVLAGGSDTEILAWCEEQGSNPSSLLRRLWNGALTRKGWRDDLSDRLQLRLQESGLADRTDIHTLFDYIEIDEGRSPRYAD